MQQPSSAVPQRAHAQSKRGVVFARSLRQGGADAPARQPPQRPPPAVEVLSALKGAAADVVGAAVSGGRQVAATGAETLTVIIANRYGADAAALSHDSVAAVVATLRAVGHIKTFGALRLAKHTALEAGKGVVVDGLRGGGGGAGPGVRVKLRVEDEEGGGGGRVRLELSEDDRVVAAVLRPVCALVARGTDVRLEERLQLQLMVLREPGPPARALLASLSRRVAAPARALGAAHAAGV